MGSRKPGLSELSSAASGRGGKAGWARAELADLLGALGLMSLEDSRKAVEAYSPDPTLTARTCRSGEHLWISENIYVRGDGRRGCKPCGSRHKRDQRTRKLAAKQERNML